MTTQTTQTPTAMAILFWVLSVLLAARPVAAFGNGAGSCPEGRAAVDALHLRNSAARTVTTGSLREGGFDLVVHGISLVEEQAEQQQPDIPQTAAVAVPVGVDVVWTLSAKPTKTVPDKDNGNSDNAFFRGFLLRLNRGDSDTLDTVDALLPPLAEEAENEANGTTASSDPSPPVNVTLARGVCHVLHEVGGVTHTNNLEKESVSGLLHVADTSRNLRLDVTVVVENRLFSSIFFYSGFVLDALPSLGTTTDSSKAGEAACNATHPCGVCQGDCNLDSDCQAGLECFRRPGIDDSPVVGCYGRGDPGVDYCYMPKNEIARLRNHPCSEYLPCDKCVGDCNMDSDCRGDYKCFHRTTVGQKSDTQGSIPGCEGTGVEGLDYCYDSRHEQDRGDWEDGFCITQADCHGSTFFLDSDGNLTTGDNLTMVTLPTLTPGCSDNQCFYTHPCGPNVCRDSEYCCSESCGTCVAYADVDAGCDTEVFCIFDDTQKGGGQTNDKKADDTDRPIGMTCQEDRDCFQFVGCPATTTTTTTTSEEVDCPMASCRRGRCAVKDTCGTLYCEVDEYCCNSDCGLCVSLREACEPDLACDDRTDDDRVLAMTQTCEETSECTTNTISICLEEPCPETVCYEGACRLMQPCGPHAYCEMDESCCNMNCGTCVAAGGTCDPDFECEPCGNVLCGEAEYCCNAGCNECAPLRGSCLNLLCNPDDGTIDDDDDNSEVHQEKNMAADDDERRKLLRARHRKTEPS